MWLLFVHAAPTGVPRRVSPSSTSTSIMVTWDIIDCIERNGVITSYLVEFKEEGGAGIPGEVMGQSFTTSGLTPSTSYTFRIAGVNANGTGPFTENMTTNTSSMDEVISTATTQEETTNSTTMEQGKLISQGRRKQFETGQAMV